MGSVVALQSHLRGEYPEADVLRQAQDVRAVEDGPWLSAQEIADARLPGLPKNKRKVNEMSNRERWAFKVAADGSALARTRKGRGGGIEYHVDLLPTAARARLLKDHTPVCVSNETPEGPSLSIWSWFDNQNNTVKAKAKRNLAILTEVERDIASGSTATAAIATSAALNKVGASTISTWRRAVFGVDPADWLPHVAPRYVGGGKESDVDPELLRFYKSLYLTNNQRCHTTCYRKTLAVAKDRGLTLPHPRTMQRKLEREVDELVIIRKRLGDRAVAATFPPQQRSVQDLHALELVNVDGHLWDVFVRWPGIEKPVRPMMVAIQDVHSRMILGYRFDLSENVAVTRLAFYDVFKKFGIPKGCLLDNSRTFASKKLTEGAKTRFRGKIKDEAPAGILPALNINPHWATPYHGQAKPIERAFRDLCLEVSRGALEFEGAWTGNRVDNKPANYGSKMVDFDVFLKVVAAGIDEHNKRQGRDTEMCQKRLSFEQAFDASYSKAIIQKAGEEHLRLAMLSTEHCILANRKSGAVKLYGNIYWCEQLFDVSGERVSVRFDPDDLAAGVHVYAGTGEYITFAPLEEQGRFLSEDAAKMLAKRKADYRKKVKAADQAYDFMNVEEMKAFQVVPEPEDFEPDAKIVSPLRIRGNTAMLLKPVAAVDAVATDVAKSNPLKLVSARDESALKAASNVSSIDLVAAALRRKRLEEE